MTDGSPSHDLLLAQRMETTVSSERFAGYLAHCGGGDAAAAVELYRWNGELAGAFWESLGHVEVVLRNTLDNRMRHRQRRRRTPDSWLSDPTVGLDQRGRADIVKARRRVASKCKQPGDGQLVSELGFGFWRFLLARRYQSDLWPDLAGGFPNAPSRDRRGVEEPVVRLHDFRNRIAHQQRV
jgi:hypothetical protein